VELTEDLGIRHEVVHYEDEFDVRMDDVVEDDPESMAACAYCGVFRRDVLSRYAEELGADKLLTGHNLDDEAETALMNFLEGDVRQMAKHFEASLGPFDGDSRAEEDHGDGDGGDGGGSSDAATDHAREDQDHHVPRAKPPGTSPRKRSPSTPDSGTSRLTSPNARTRREAYRGEIQQLMLKLEENHPGTRHSIAGWLRGTRLAGVERTGPRRRGHAGLRRVRALRRKPRTARDLCRKCGLLDALEAV